MGTSPGNGDLPEGWGPPQGWDQQGEGRCWLRPGLQGQPRAPLTLCRASAMLRTKAVDSAVQDLTVSVRPSRKSRVMEAS